MDVATVLARALSEAMKEARLRDEEVAIRTGVTASTVRFWRLGKKIPKGPVWQLLRDTVPGFGSRIDDLNRQARRHAS